MARGRWPGLGLGLVSLASLGGYLLWSAATLRVGFPLDDAWIHQVYARNLGLHGGWAFEPGQPSGGSTAPLWGMLLAGGYALGVNPFVWTFALGWATLWGVALAGYAALRGFVPERKAAAGWGALLLAVEWHLVWAAGSGMETLLFSLLVVVVLVWAAAGWGRPFWLGALVGAAVWLRPDGMTLLGPAGWALWFGAQTGRARLRQGGALLAGFLLLFGPYLGFNLAVAGAAWPNTLAAKQAEYAVLRERFFGARLVEQAGLVGVGVGAVVLPGVALFLRQAVVERRWEVLGGALWWAGYVALYAWRLPVTYQHGRYLMPAMPVFLLWGVAGMAGWARPRAQGAARRVVSRAWLAAAGLAAAGFWVLGAQAYGRDVAIIETEMVAAARWVQAHTPAGARVAAHDIGALGYFAQRPLIDLAGLVSPEVVPFLRDEEKLGAYLDSRGAAYLVTLRGWYPALEARGVVVYESTGSFSPEAGGEPMRVYRWPEKGGRGEAAPAGQLRANGALWIIAREYLLHP